MSGGSKKKRVFSGPIASAIYAGNTLIGTITQIELRSFRATAANGRRLGTYATARAAMAAIADAAQAVAKMKSEAE